LGPERTWGRGGHATAPSSPRNQGGEGEEGIYRDERDIGGGEEKAKKFGIDGLDGQDRDGEDEEEIGNPQGPEDPK